MMERKREKALLKSMMTLEDFRFYCERQFLTDVAILDNKPRFEPRYTDRFNQLRQEVAEMTNEIKFSPKWWAKNKVDDKNKVLVELVDALKFYCGMVMDDFTKARHIETEMFERITERAYLALWQEYDNFSLEDSEYYAYAEMDELRRFLIGKAFDSFEGTSHRVFSRALRILATFDVDRIELRSAYLDKNDIVHARNEGDY